MTFLDQIQSIIEFSKQYQILAGFVGASTVGTLLVLLRRIPWTIMGWIKYHFTVEMITYSDHVYFDWLDNWLAEQKFAKRSRNVILVEKPFRDG